MPTLYDPVATPPPSAEDLAKYNSTNLPRETVNGIAAKLTESTSDQIKSRIWVAVNGNYPVKAEMTMPGGQPMLMLEVKELRFEKPAAALFTPPASCPTQAQGEWSATSISAHGEMNVNVHASGSVDLGTGKTTGNATVKTGGK
jgi:hypothetical protein